MKFGITAISVYTSIIVFIMGVIRNLYLATRNKKRFPPSLFEGKYLLCFFIFTISGIAMFILTFFYSSSLFVTPNLFLWILISNVLMCLWGLLWIVYYMHGYETRYQFKKVLVPAPMIVCEIGALFATALLTNNYPCIVLSIVYGVTAGVWNYRAYKLTLPPIPDDEVLRENDDFI